MSKFIKSMLLLIAMSLPSLAMANCYLEVETSSHDFFDTRTKAETFCNTQKNIFAEGNNGYCFVRFQRNVKRWEADFRYIQTFSGPSYQTDYDDYIDRFRFRGYPTRHQVIAGSRCDNYDPPY